MQTLQALWPTPIHHLRRARPDHPVLYLAPDQLRQTALYFQDFFPGEVTYAVKANDREEVLANLVASGLRSFDVASIVEMKAVRQVLPSANLHYNNPVRSVDEVAQASEIGVQSWSVDTLSELQKLDQIPRDCEVAVRFALPVAGAAYDFGGKFGATPQEAVALLRQVAQMGFTAALCFHPGTQCEDPAAWTLYIQEAAGIAAQAGVRLARLNVGGGFAAHRCAEAPDLRAVFDAIRTARDSAFGADAPQLICEPGRAMVAEAFVLAARVKSLRNAGEVVYLNDGIYGGLTDLRDMGLIDRIAVVSPSGQPRLAPTSERIVFGPTCDSLDRLPDGLALPQDTAEGDYVLFSAMGAYSVAMSTRFNGYGLNDVVTVQSLSGQSA